MIENNMNMNASSKWVISHIFFTCEIIVKTLHCFKSRCLKHGHFYINILDSKKGSTQTTSIGDRCKNILTKVF